MNTPKTDPRVARTRLLLEEAFVSLLHEKGFKAITVRDITERAKVNRATFYAHFVDKYEMLDTTMSASFHESLKQKLDCEAVFNERSIASLLTLMCSFHKDLSHSCKKSYQSLESNMERKMIGDLREVIYHLLLNKSNMDAVASLSIEESNEMYKMVSITLSWSIYGAAFSWNENGQLISVEELVSRMVPILANGVANYFPSPVVIV